MANPEAPVKGFLSILITPTLNREELHKKVAQSFGPPEMISPDYPFNLTYYYAQEMGSPLWRYFYVFQGLQSAEKLVDWKKQGGKIEDVFRVEGKRRVNIDPGYVDYNKVVLGSAKPGGWKIYLGQEVWADMTLYYAKGSFIRFGWTFPDFREGLYDRFLLKIRQAYKLALKPQTHQ